MPRLSPQEIAARREGMGATDIVEVALAPTGDVPWEDAGPMRVFARKRGYLPESEPTPEQEWGHVQEQILLAHYSQIIGEPLLPTGQVRDVLEPWMWATVDAKVISKSLNVEAKNVGRFMCRDWDEHAEDGIPHHVRAQVVLGMRCTSNRFADVVASLGGAPPKIWRVAFDPELADLLVDVGRRFWHEHVLKDEPPPLDGSDACKAYLRAKYPKDDRPMLEADDAATEIALKRAAAAIVQDRSEDERKRLDAELMKLCGDAKGIERKGVFSFTWKLDKNGKRATRFTDRQKKGSSDGDE